MSPKAPVPKSHHARHSLGQYLPLKGRSLAGPSQRSQSKFSRIGSPAGIGKPIRNRILRFTATGNAGGAPTVIVDDLPIGNVHNAGDLEFGNSGTGCRLMMGVGSYRCCSVERPFPSSRTSSFWSPLPFRFLGFGIGVMNWTVRRRSMIRWVG